MSALSDLGLLQKVALYQLLKETTPYLLHPGIWIRQATAGFISSVAKTLNPVDVMVKLSTLLAPYLTHKVVSLQDPVVILNHLMQPVPRPLYEDVIKCAEVETFFSILEERQTRRTVSRTNQSVQQYSDMSVAMQHMYRRLQADGMSSTVEDKLMLMKDNLLKTARNRQTYKREAESLGTVDLDKGPIPVSVRSDDLHFDHAAGGGGSGHGGSNSNVAAQGQLIHEHQGSSAAAPPAQQGNAVVNEEWNLMFGNPNEGLGHEIGIEAGPGTTRGDTPARFDTPSPSPLRGRSASTSSRKASATAAPSAFESVAKNRDSNDEGHHTCKKSVI
jgi:hypothetical protein